MVQTDKRRHSMKQLKAIILAAGKGTRMKSDLPKVLHTIHTKPLAAYVIDAAKGAGAEQICLVIGYQADRVKKEFSDCGVTFALQEEQLGTGHAVMCAGDFLTESGNVFILCGDTPLITAQTLKAFAAYHEQEKNAVTVLSAQMEDATGYGRIIRNEDGTFVKSVEHKDASEKELQSHEVNAGMYLFDGAYLREALTKLTTDNAQGEYYLPDTLTFIKAAGGKADAYQLADATEIMGVNTQEQLKVAADVIKQRNA